MKNNLKDLKEWLKELKPNENIDDYVSLVWEDNLGYSFHGYRCNLYTEEFTYTITAVESSDDNGSLEVVINAALARNCSRLGERIVEGDLSRDTWNKALVAILGNEMKKNPNFTYIKPSPVNLKSNIVTIIGVDQATIDSLGSGN